MLASARFLQVVALIALAGCGGSSSDNGSTGPKTNPTVNRSMSARVDGAAWTATNIAASGTNGTLIISGTRGTDLAVSLVASLGQGTGTQTVGRGSAALGTVTIGNTQWVAGQLQGSGSITLTTVTATRVVGTFTFTAQAVTQATSPATKTVTSGAFDVTF